MSSFYKVLQTERTPLHIAAKNAAIKTVNVLLEHGVDIELRDKVVFTTLFSTICLPRVILSTAAMHFTIPPWSIAPP